MYTYNLHIIIENWILIFFSGHSYHVSCNIHCPFISNGKFVTNVIDKTLKDLNVDTVYITGHFLDNAMDANIETIKEEFNATSSF